VNVRLGNNSWRFGKLQRLSDTIISSLSSTPPSPPPSLPPYLLQASHQSIRLGSILSTSKSCASSNVQSCPPDPQGPSAFLSEGRREGGREGGREVNG